MFEGPLSGEVPPFLRGQLDEDVDGSGIGSWITNLGKKLLTSDKIRSSAMSAAKSGANALLGKGADTAKNKILSSSKVPEAVKKDLAEIPKAASDVVKSVASDAVNDTLSNAVKEISKEEAVKRLNNFLALPTKVGMGTKEMEELNKIKDLLYKNE